MRPGINWKYLLASVHGSKDWSDFSAVLSDWPETEVAFITNEIFDPCLGGNIQFKLHIEIVPSSAWRFPEGGRGGATYWTVVSHGPTPEELWDMAIEQLVTQEFNYSQWWCQWSQLPIAKVILDDFLLSQFQFRWCSSFSLSSLLMLQVHFSLKLKFWIFPLITSGIVTEYCTVIGTHSPVWGDKLLWCHVPDPFPWSRIGSGHMRLCELHGSKLAKLSPTFLTFAMYWLLLNCYLDLLHTLRSVLSFLTTAEPLSAMLKALCERGTCCVCWRVRERQEDFAEVGRA